MTVPVARSVIAGSDTYAYYAMASERVADCLPDAGIATMDGVGHDGPYTRPEELARRVLGFLDEHPTEEAPR